MRKFYDRKREPRPDFKIGNKVLLDAKHIQTLRPSKKLDHRMRGPWTIIKRVGSRAFELDLKENRGRKHDVSLLACWSLITKALFLNELSLHPRVTMMIWKTCSIL